MYFPKYVGITSHCKKRKIVLLVKIEIDRKICVRKKIWKVPEKN